MAKSEETKFAMHVVAVIIFDCEKQNFGCTLEAKTALTAFIFGNRFLKISRSSFFVPLSDVLNTQAASTELSV